jgi:hypothetical protein
MFGFIKTTLVGAAVAATALTAAAPANAGDWHRHHGFHHHRGNAGDIVAAGIIGAAAGAVLGSVLAPSPAPVYVDPYPRYPSYPAYSTYYRPAPTYYRPAPRVVYVQPAAQPWTRAWYNDCAARYRSFDPGSGTYLGYDGARHFCDLN